MHPPAGMTTPLIVLLQDSTCLRAWLESLPPHRVIGEKLCPTRCPVHTFLSAHAVPVTMVDQAWIVLTTGQEVETPGWLSHVMEVIDMSVAARLDLTTLYLDVTARDLLTILDDLEGD